MINILLYTCCLFNCLGKVNRPVSSEVFDQVYDQMVQYLNDKDLYIFDGFAGANRKYQYGFRVINEKASQNLFIRNLLIRPKKEQLKDFKEDFLILVAPGCKVDYKKLGLNSEAAIMINFEKQIILIAGTGYSGEIKKSVFCVMNYLLPQKKIFTMHCSANRESMVIQLYSLDYQELEKQHFQPIQTDD